MTVQTQYNNAIDTALAGLIYDQGNTDIDSFAAEAVIGFGTFAMRGTAIDQVLVSTGASVGITVRAARENDLPAGAYDHGAYAITETVGVMRSGYIWAQFDAVGGTVGAAVTINASGQVVAAGGGTALTGVKAVVERGATDVFAGGGGLTTQFVGLVQVFPV